MVSSSHETIMTADNFSVINTDAGFHDERFENIESAINVGTIIDDEMASSSHETIMTADNFS
eukprot:9639391-Heterocapsa_arctica.AAC.1